MAKIEFSNATMYIAEPDSGYTPIGQVKDFECTCSDSDDPPSYMSLANLSDSFECVCKLSKEAAMAIFGVRDAVIKCCPNQRVVHLALHAKKARTRKKNFHRAIKILEVLK